MLVQEEINRKEDKMFTAEEILNLKIFNQTLTYRPIQIAKQKHMQENNHKWCIDWETIEICKCLFNGEDTYRLDPAPNRLKGNPFWSPEAIITIAKNKIKMLNWLRSNINFSNRLFICGVERGIDLTIATMAKSWEEIYCSDINEFMLAEVNYHFKIKLGLPVETAVLEPNDIDFTQIEEKTILILNLFRVSQDKIEEIRKNPNILGYFLEGVYK